MNDEDDGLVEDANEQHVFQTGRPSQSSFISSILSTSIEFFESYGWFILVGGIILYLIYNRYKDRYISSYIASSTKEHSNYDEDLALKRMKQLEEARKRQQEALDAAAAKYLAEKKAKDEQKIKEKAEDFQRLQEGKSKIPRADEFAHSALNSTNSAANSTDSSNKKPKFRQADYNPLTGSGGGGSCGYRPSKRGGTRGGGG